MVHLKKSEYLRRLDGVDIESIERFKELLEKFTSNPPLSWKPFATMEEGEYEFALWVLVGDNSYGCKLYKGHVIVVDDRGWMYTLLRRWGRIRRGKRISRFKLRRIHPENLSDSDVRRATAILNDMVQIDAIRKVKPKA